MATDLSELEQLRLENIRRNAQFLSDLGFYSTCLAKKEDAIATSKERENRESRGKRNSAGSGSTKNNKNNNKNNSSNDSDNGERRFSRRLRAKTDEVKTEEVEEEVNKLAEVY